MTAGASSTPADREQQARDARGAATAPGLEMSNDSRRAFMVYTDADEELVLRTQRNALRADDLSRNDAIAARKRARG